MLHRVVMNVFHVSHEIGVVPDQMLPKPALPDHDLTFLLSRWYGGLFVLRSKMPAETFLDQTHACRKIEVFRRQSQHAMDMIRQDYGGLDCNGLTSHDGKIAAVNPHLRRARRSAVSYKS